MVHRVEIFGNDRGIVVLQTLKVYHLSNITNRFYVSPKLKNWMCEPCTFIVVTHNIVNYYICIMNVIELSEAL